MLRRHPGVFVAGEMLDWEAPTGGYLLAGLFFHRRGGGAGCAGRGQLSRRLAAIK